MTPATQVFQASAYGLVGDGKTDNTAAFQRAVQAAIAAGGGQVMIGCGEFLVNTPASQAPGQRSILYFKNASGIQITGSGSCSHLFTLLPQKSVLEFNASTNINVSALKISAVNAAYIETFGLDGGSAIRFSAVAQGSIQSVEIDGAAAGAIYLTTGTSHVTVSGNNIHDTYGSGIWEDDCGGVDATDCSPSTPPSYNSYTGNTLLNTARLSYSAIGFDDGGSSSNALVEKNIIAWTTTFVPIKNGGFCIGLNNVSNASVLDNTCTDSPYDGIALSTGVSGSAVGDDIEGNIITSSGRSAQGGDGIVVYNAPTGKGISGFTIKGNTISLSSSDGIALYSMSGPGGIHDGIVEGNTITNVDQGDPGTSFGIQLDDVAGTTVLSNVIEGGGTSIAVGLMFTGSSGTGVSQQVLGNTVQDILGPDLEVN